MRYIITLRIDGGKPRTYPIDASSEEQAIERLRLRLPPNRRESFEVDSIGIDMSTVGTEEPFGIYTGE